MQSKLGSLVETMTNIVIGFIISFVLNATLLPALGYNVTFSENLVIVLAFTIVSMIRSYILRRFFNWVSMTSSNK